ncbi:hypothetical protein DFH06DRAFT_1212681, partial [Mycena polygramma]
MVISFAAHSAVCSAISSASGRGQCRRSPTRDRDMNFLDPENTVDDTAHLPQLAPLLVSFNWREATLIEHVLWLGREFFASLVTDAKAQKIQSSLPIRDRNQINSVVVGEFCSADIAVYWYIFCPAQCVQCNFPANLPCNLQSFKLTVKGKPITANPPFPDQDLSHTLGGLSTISFHSVYIWHFSSISTNDYANCSMESTVDPLCRFVCPTIALNRRRPEPFRFQPSNVSRRMHALLSDAKLEGSGL